MPFWSDLLRPSILTWAPKRSWRQQNAFWVFWGGDFSKKTIIGYRSCMILYVCHVFNGHLTNEPPRNQKTNKQNYRTGAFLALSRPLLHVFCRVAMWIGSYDVSKSKAFVHAIISKGLLALSCSEHVLSEPKACFDLAPAIAPLPNNRVCFADGTSSEVLCFVFYFRWCLEGCWKYSLLWLFLISKVWVGWILIWFCSSVCEGQNIIGQKDWNILDAPLTSD